MIWVGQNSIAYLSLLVIYVCLKKGKSLTLKTCAPDFSARSMTKLYAKIKGTPAVSLFDFLKTWQVWSRDEDNKEVKMLMRQSNTPIFR